MKLGDLSIDWIAAFFDGEGCISITNNGNRGHLRAFAALTNTYEPIVREYQRRYGGKIFYRKPFDRTRGQWQWQISSRAMEPFLRDIEPLLVIKKKQARLALRFCATMNLNSTHALPESLRAKRVKMRDEIQQLNQGVIK